MLNDFGSVEVREFVEVEKLPLHQRHVNIGTNFMNQLQFFYIFYVIFINFIRF